MAKQSQPSNAWPPGAIGKPAGRALMNANIASLRMLAKWSEADLLALHGVGPKAIRILKEMLAAEGLALK